MGPAIFKKQKGETVYAIRCIPFGGYVAMKGEETTIVETPAGHESAQELDTEGSYLHAKLWKRVLISLAGSVMNLVCALVILLIIMLPQKYISTAKLSGFMDGFALEGQNGLMAGDQLLKINDFTIFTYGDVVNALELGQGDTYDMLVRRGGKKVKVENLPLR